MLCVLVMVHSRHSRPPSPRGKPHKYKKYSQFRAYSECLLPSNATKIFLVSDMICLRAKRYNQSKVSLKLSRNVKKWALPLSRWSNTAGYCSRISRSSILHVFWLAVDSSTNQRSWCISPPMCIACFSLLTTMKWSLENIMRALLWIQGSSIHNVFV